MILAVMLALLAGALAAPAAQPVSKPKAEEIYRARCQKCHGPDGHAPQKGSGLSFADGEWTHGSDLKSVVQVITNGVPETGMNPFKDQLSPEEIQALARYVRSLDKNLKK
jgi:mono/diheme cytochrome c family protein